MKIQQLNSFGFDSESKQLGAIMEVSFINQTAKIMVDDETIVEAKLENVTTLEILGEVNGVVVINHDVVTTTNGDLFELVLREDGSKVLDLFLLDESLEQVEKVDSVHTDDIALMNEYFDFVANINSMELVEEETVDFNVGIVRGRLFDGEINYFYACNNKDAEEIDLIKVVFIGAELLEEEYKRVTVSHEEYLEMVANETLKEVSKQELMNYATGVMYGYHDDVESNEIDEDEENDCDDCDCDDVDECSKW